MLHQIGAGALGPVFRAYQPEQDRLVAVKLFRLDLPPERVHRLLASLETLVAADLSHPAIAAPAGTGITGASAYLAQDFVAADSLDVVVRSSGASSPGEVALVAAQLASALDFAAAQYILHGALHPRDVLMSTDDVRLTGLGVTQALEQVEIYTPVRRPYSAPERAVRGPWDRRADVFSLAALMFELLYARRVSGAGAQAVASLPEIVGANQAQLKRVFTRALAADAADRFDTAVAFADALQIALSDAGSMGVDADLPPRSEIPPLAVVPAPKEAVAALEHFALTTSDDEAQPSELLLPLDAPDFDISVPAESDTTSVLEDRSGGDLHLHGPAVEQDEAATAAAAALPYAAGALESTRSAVWPLVLALVVGIALGFGMAMVLIGRGPSPEALQQAQASSPSPVVVAEPPIVPVTDASRPTPASGGSEPAQPARPASVTPPPAQARPAPSVRPARPAEPVPAAPARPALPAPPAPLGRIVVRSTPPGAQVFLDGKSAGVTPVTLRDVSRGSHAVRVAREGFVTAQRRVAVGGNNQSLSVVVDLARVRSAPAPLPQPPASKPTPQTVSQIGSLYVDSRPTGARVFVDGKLVGTAPLLLSTLGPGEHALQLESEGYRRWDSMVKIVAGERTRVAASLER